MLLINTATQPRRAAKEPSVRATVLVVVLAGIIGAILVFFMTLGFPGF